MASKKLPIVSSQELHKRSSSNQVKQLEKFAYKDARDKIRASKSVDYSPKMAWNRRGDCVKLLDEYEAKCKELNDMFDKKLEFNSKKYLPALEKVRAKTQKDYEQFVAESNKRIKEYEAEIEHIRSFALFKEMASELCPEKSVNLPSDSGMKPICWVDEQKPNSSAEQPNIPRKEKNKLKKVGAVAAKLAAAQHQEVDDETTFVTTVANGQQRSNKAMKTGVILDRPTSESSKEIQTKKLQNLKIKIHDN